jgi:hypothetical protein
MRRKQMKTKYVIRTSYKGWENGSGWICGPNFFDEIDVTDEIMESSDGIKMKYESNLYYFDWLTENIDIETYIFNSENDTLWIRELILIEPDREFPEYGTQETVIYCTEEWESDLIQTFFNLDQ